MKTWAEQFDRKIKSLERLAKDSDSNAGMRRIKKDPYIPIEITPGVYIIETAPGVYRRPCVRDLDFPKPHQSKIYL